MDTQFSEAQVLVDLGLTLKQARVYVALSNNGPLRVLDISKISKVARPDVYNILSNLQEMGLVEKLIRTPYEYFAVPVRNAVSLLLDRKEKQFKKIKTETSILLETIERKELQKPETNNNFQLVLVPGGKAIIEKIRSAIEKTESSIDLFLSFKRFSVGLASTFSDSIEIAWAKNVRTRFLVEHPSKTITSKQLIVFCEEKPSCEIRFFPHHPETIFGIYDKQEMFVITNPQTDLPGSSALWTTNKSLISLANDHFNCLWSIAMKQL